MVLFMLALAPAIFILLYVYARDAYDREPLKQLLISFALGIFVAIPTVLVGNWLANTMDLSTSSEGWGLFVYAFFVVALVEEGMKFLALRGYAYRSPEFDEPYDGIMYSVTISMGFAAIENVMYAMEGGFNVAWLRMFSAVPAHAVFGVAMGYFVGKSRFAPPQKRIQHLAQGLGIAIVLHGIYDYFLFQPFTSIPELALVSFLLVYVGVFYAHKAMKQHKDTAIHRWREEE